MLINFELRIYLCWKIKRNLTVRFTYTTIQKSICVILDLPASFNTTLTVTVFRFWPGALFQN